MADLPNHFQKQPLDSQMPSASSCSFKSLRATAQGRRFALAAGILVICFAVPLWQLFGFAAHSDLYSYIILIPFISFYLLWLNRETLPISIQPARLLSAIFLFAGVALAAVYWLWLRSRLQISYDDYLAIMTICFLLLFYGVSSLFWGTQTLRASAFPLVFLIFMVPIPLAAIQQVNSFLQFGSAIAAAGFFSLTGTSFFQDGLAFHLSDIRLEIAPECSGLHSTLVLFLTSLLASYIFLRTPWKRALLTFFVIPLGLLRNGFRVFVIGQMCIHMGPQMIDSPIHHKGGPIFFVLSLIPLFLLLLILHKSEKGGPGTGLEISKTCHV
jgi:exosortase C (VPDSG-CTERM-specific)